MFKKFVLGLVLLNSQLASAEVANHTMSGFYKLENGNEGCPAEMVLSLDRVGVHLNVSRQVNMYGGGESSLLANWGKKTVGYESSDIIVGRYADEFEFVDNREYGLGYKKFEFDVVNSKDGVMIKTDVSFKRDAFFRPFLSPVIQKTHRLETFVEKADERMVYERYESVEQMKKGTQKITTKLHCEYIRNSKLMKDAFHKYLEKINEEKNSLENQKEVSESTNIEPEENRTVMTFSPEVVKEILEPSELSEEDIQTVVNDLK